MRQIADWCSEVSSLKSSVASADHHATFDGKVGDWVLRFAAIRGNSLEPYYQGPYKITEVLGSDFFTVREILAGDALGKAVQVHSSRLIKFDESKTSPDAEHQRKLPKGHFVVSQVLRGPDAAHPGQFQIQWFGVDNPTWEQAHGLRQVLKFRQFCQDNNLTLEGVPKKPRPSSVTLSTAPLKEQVRSLRDDSPGDLGALHSLFVPIFTEFYH